MPQLPSSCLLSCHNRISLNFGSAGTFRLLCPPYKSRRLYGCWGRRSGLLLWWKIYLEHFLLTFPKSQLFQSDDQENRQIRLPPLLLLKKKSQLIDDEDDMMNVCSIHMVLAVSFLPESGWKLPHLQIHSGIATSSNLFTYNTVPKLGNVPLPNSLEVDYWVRGGLFGTSGITFSISGNRQQKAASSTFEIQY